VHLHSGEAARFRTRDELLAFTCRVLNRLARQQGGGRPTPGGGRANPRPSRSTGTRRTAAEGEGDK